MLRRTKLFSVVLLAMMVGIWFTPTPVEATRLPDSQRIAPKLQAFDVDEFTYRISFQLSDRTEVFLFRSRFGLIYLYQHHQPTVSQHHMWATVGFFYTKTVLGRNVIRNITFNHMAFYPKWIDATGVTHDLLYEPDSALFEKTESIADGQLLGGYMLVEDLAPSKFVQLMGGTLVFSGLGVILENGVEVEIGDLEIVLEKHFNENLPYDATMESEDNLNYTSDFQYMIVVGSGVAPLVVLLDSVLGFTLVGTAALVVVLLILHLKGRIKLPLDKISKALTRRQPSVIE